MDLEALFSRAADRDGVLWTGDARPADMSVRQLRARARREGWESPFPRTWLAPGARMNDGRLLTAATLTTEGAASRFSALRLHGLDVAWPPRPQVIVPSDRVGTRVSGVDVRRSRTLRAQHITEVSGTRTSIVERALADAAPSVSARALRNLLIDAEHAGLASVDSFARLRAELRPGVPGLRTMDAALRQLATSRSDSPFEHEVRDGLREAAVAVHPEPFPYRCRDGVLVHLDIAVPAAWVAVECDGRAHHSDRRAFSVDRTRWTQIAVDWRIVWVTWDRWRDDRSGVIADVQRAVAAASSDPRGPATPAAPATSG